MKNEITVVNQESIKDKIYIIRGQQVMIDSDLAKIYGYTTKAFNQQVQRNINKFDEDFMFQLTDEEISKLSRSHFVTLMQTKGIKGGRTYYPYAFTEQGIYMLMTVLKGELATNQSKVLIRTFKAMKDYIINTNNFVTYNEFSKLVMQTNENTKTICEIKENMATKNDIAMIMENFIDKNKYKEFLILNGNYIEADLAYENIYNLAKKSIYIIDNYINIKTLSLIKNTKNIDVIIFSDNINNNLKKFEYDDFCKEHSNINSKIKKINNICHDRYIIIDYDLKSEIIYHCGSSSKDAGKKITSIVEINNKEIYHDLINSLLKNSKLILK